MRWWFLFVAAISMGIIVWMLDETEADKITIPIMIFLIVVTLSAITGFVLSSP